MKRNKTLGFVLATVMVFGSVATANTAIANAASNNAVQETSIPGMPENEKYTVYKNETAKLNKIAEEVINAANRMYTVEFTKNDGTLVSNASEIANLVKSGTIGQVVFAMDETLPVNPENPNGATETTRHIFATIYIKDNVVNDEEKAPAKGSKWRFKQSDLDKNPELNAKLEEKLNAAYASSDYKVIESTLREGGKLIRQYAIYKLDKNSPASELYYTVEIEYNAIVNNWIKDNDGYWYYYDANGNAVKGFQKVAWNGVTSTYYFDQEGRMQTGWKKINNKWYYFNPGGSMKTGWLKSANKWYYLKDNGVMVTGWNKINYNKPGLESKNQSYWFYFGPSGDMAYGWKKIDNKWYYFDGYGTMAQNIVVDGKYFVDHSGVWDGITR